MSMIARVVWHWLRLQRNQWLPGSEVEKLQFRKLTSIMKHAYDHVPFYRRLYDRHGVHPNDLRSIEDIRRFPVLSKELVRDEPLSERTARGVDMSRCTLKTTSGSTGIPLSVLEDEHSIDYLDAYHLRRLFEYRYRPWESIVRVTTEPPGKETLGATGEARAGLMKTLRESRVKRLVIAEDVYKHLEIMREANPKFIVGPPSYLKVVAKVASEQEITRIRPRVLMTWGEILDDSTRAYLSSAFGSEVYDGYGSVEIAPIGGLAWECRERSGLHVNSDTVVLEFLKDGEPVAPGERGEVVATSLFRFATPMIRYRLGDIATPSDGFCPCGRGFPLVRNIEGRLVDFLTMLDGTPISPYAVMFAVQDINGIARYQVVQESQRKITATIERGKGFNQDTVTKFKAACLALFASEIDLEINVVESFPLEKGKKFRVVASRVR